MADNGARRGVSRIIGSLMSPVVDAVDLDAVIERVDLNDALDRVDVDRLVSRIDINAVLERVDIDRLLNRIDVDALLEHADIAGLVARANVGNVVTDTATTAATSVLDFGRGQLAGFDTVLARVFSRVLRRSGAASPDGGRSIAGTPAGAFSRLAAYAIDTTIITALFGLGVFLFTYLIDLFLDRNFDPTVPGGTWWAVGAVVFTGLYWWLSLAIAGRTVGKALLGLRVVANDGAPVGAGRALIRVLVFPFSFILGLGFIGIVVGRDRRAFHDVVAGTKEVYDWGRRPALLPAGFEHRPHAA